MTKPTALAVVVITGFLLAFSYIVFTFYDLDRGSSDGIGYNVIISNLEIPWSMAFAPDGRLFFTERPGRVRVWHDGELDTIEVEGLQVHAVGEGGLLGMALDPEFPMEPFVYLYYTYFKGGRVLNRVSRYEFSGERLRSERILLDEIPGANFHDGGRIRFGPEGALYVTTGDAGDGSSAQDLGSLAGKILRIWPDGSIPKDNPFPNSPVYSMGHRNPQGIDWHPGTMTLFSSEHGPSGEGLAYAHDEVNLIVPGRNYGWPTIIGVGQDPRFVDPVIESGSETWAPSGASFYIGGTYPGLNNSLLVATLRGEHIRVVAFEATDSVKVRGTYPILTKELGRIRDVVQGPDGFLYVATSNRDGRGTPAYNDDRIVRLIPINN